MNILITGAAGYIGSHAVYALLNDHNVIALDNLNRGYKTVINSRIPFYEIDIRNTSAVIGILHKHDIQVVMHFAGYAYVGESIDYPLDYYDNNVTGIISLLSAISQSKQCRKLIFSSSCATYGNPEVIPITEETPQNPINPYGASKLMAERIISDFSLDNFSYAILRYFNVAGASMDGVLGECHEPETHIIPIILKTILGQRNGMTIFGDNYPTYDGTCIRDFIHVDDLVQAHIIVMEALKANDRLVYNLGIGRGYSIYELIELCSKYGQVNFTIGNERPGDPPALITDSEKIFRELGWKARYDIDHMIDSAYEWFSKHS